MSLVKEAIAVGFLNLLVGTVVGYVLSMLFGVNLPAVCKNWNKNHIMELSLFLSGFLIHIICEFTGLNKWYCINGRACSKK